MRKLFMLVVCLLVLTVVKAEADNSGATGGLAPAAPSTEFNTVLPIKVSLEQELHGRFVEGILKSRSIKQKKTRKPYWFECGKRIKGKEARRERASVWSTWILTAIDEAHTAHGVELNPWGVFGVIHKESGFNVCALDFQTREWAVKTGLVKRLQQTYTRDDVYKIISSKHFNLKHRKSDLGPMQVRYGKGLSRKKMDQILSLDPGMVWAAEEMAERSVDYPIMRSGKKRPHPRPWKLWPTTNARSVRSYEYDRTITRVARWLGARLDEI